MSLDRLINLYSHSKLSLLELRAKRYLLLTGSIELEREECQLHVSAINHLIQHYKP